MGNICSKSSNKDSDNFSTPGRVLGANSDANSQPTRSTIPQAQKQKLTTSTPGRTLGSAGGDGTTSPGPNDPRSAAARAAEERANAANKPGGKLAEKLNAQKRQTLNQTLNAQSEQERLARTADENAQQRSWN